MDIGQSGDHAIRESKPMEGSPSPGEQQHLFCRPEPGKTPALQSGDRFIGFDLSKPQPERCIEFSEGHKWQRGLTVKLCDLPGLGFVEKIREDCLADNESSP